MRDNHLGSCRRLLRVPRCCRLAAAILLLTIGCWFSLTPPTADCATIDLADLLASSGATVTLNPANTYVLNDEYRITKDQALYCNGASIQAQGVLKATGAKVDVSLDQCNIASSSWGAVAAADGASVTLTKGTVSCPGGTGIYVGNAGLEASQTSITGCQFGINSEGAAQVKLHGVTIGNTPYAAQISGSSGNLTIDQHSSFSNTNYGTGLAGFDGAHISITDSLIQNFTYGINLASGTVAALAAVTIDNCPYGAQVSGSGSRLDLGGNSALRYLGHGTGVGVLQGAHASISNTSLEGFSNAIDVQPPNPGTVAVTDSSFVNNYVSALNAVGSSNVLFSNCRVSGAMADGIFFLNSTGVVEKSEVIGSLNTGVTFMGCPNGAIIRNCYIGGSAHQGIAVGKDDTTGTPSYNIEVSDNTLVGNQLAEIFVDAVSTAKIHGNILTNSPQSAVRLHGSKNIELVGNLITGSTLGFELKDSGNATMALSAVFGNGDDGLLVYNHAFLTIDHNVFDGNGLSDGNAWSVFLNTGAGIYGQYNCMGNPKDNGLYNNAGIAVTVANNYWGATSGPHTVGGSGGGANLDWNVDTGSSVTFVPYLTGAPATRSVTSAISAASNQVINWNSGQGVTIVSQMGVLPAPLSKQTLGVLHAVDSRHLNQILPAPACLDGQLYVVWASEALRRASQASYLVFYAPAASAPVYLTRRDTSGNWTPITSVWDAASHTLTAAFIDPYQLNGTFALTSALPPDSKDVEDLIVHFYQTILGRNPEAGAVAAWETGYFNYALGFDIDVRYIPTEMGRLFFLSQEYDARNRGDAQFITDCYQAFLYRDPEPGALDQWLAGQWNRAEVMSQFAESEEFQTRMATLFPGFAGDPVRNLVTVLYIGLLDRLPDKGGLLYWSDRFEAGTDIKAVAKDLGKTAVASSEFQGFHASNADIIVHLYRAYLGRFPNDSETAYWVDLLNRGIYTVNQLIDLFADSDEFDQCVNDLFH